MGLLFLFATKIDSGKNYKRDIIDWRLMNLVSLLHKNRKFLKRSKKIFLKKSLKIAKKNLRRNFFYDRILDVVK